MKKILVVFIFSMICGITAMADSSITEDRFVAWIKNTPTIDDYKLDEDSFDNYDDKEFEAMYEASCKQGICAITIKVAPRNTFPSARDLEETMMGSGKELSVDGRKAAYYVYKTMNLSTLIILVPELDVVVSVRTSKLSLEEMEMIFKKLNIEKI
jgi:hypothetical protein